MGNLKIDSLAEALKKVDDEEKVNRELEKWKKPLHESTKDPIWGKEIEYSGPPYVKTKINTDKTIVEPIHISYYKAFYNSETIPFDVQKHASINIASNYGIEHYRPEQGSQPGIIFKQNISKEASVEDLENKVQLVFNAAKELDERLNTYVEKQVQEFMKYTEPSK